MPAGHLLRKVEGSLDFSFIYEEVREKYCPDNGRPSIGPVVLFKLCIINYMCGLTLDHMKTVMINPDFSIFKRYKFALDINGKKLKIDAKAEPDGKPQVKIINKTTAAVIMR